MFRICVTAVEVDGMAVVIVSGITLIGLTGK